MRRRREIFDDCPRALRPSRLRTVRGLAGRHVQKAFDMNANYWLVNLTPHTIHLQLPDGGNIDIPSTGEARAAEICIPAPDLQYDHFGDGGMHINVPLVSKRFGDVTGLPESRPHTLYIFSTVVQSACLGRRDLVAPHDMLRDDKGRVTGCRSFSFSAPA